MNMKFLLAFAFIAIIFTNVSAQHEYSPIQEKEVKYLDWTYKSVADGKDINLSNFSKGKKLVMVVYFAAWCPNWKYQAPQTQALYLKYKDKGFDIIGVSEYASLVDVKKQIAEIGLTFPIVLESDSRDAKQKTLHYGYRTKAGDTRGWGSPWNIFISPAATNKKDEFLAKKAFVANGEFINEETEIFIRKNLGLKDETKKPTIAANKAIEACSEKEPIITLKKP
jgi:peroxiredoxin